MSRNRTRVQTQRRIAESAVAGVHIAPAEPLSPQPPALGNMSEADLAAIRGAAPMTASELLASGGVPVTEGQPFHLEGGHTPPRETSPEELDIASRVLTLEGRCVDLEKAVEALAAYVRAMGSAPTPAARVATVSASSVGRPTPEEESAYCETNLAMSQLNDRPYDGIQAWRNAGSPVMKAKPVVNPLARGRAA